MQKIILPLCQAEQITSVFKNSPDTNILKSWSWEKVLNHVIWINSLTKKYNLQKVTQNLKQKNEITSYQVNKSNSCQGSIETTMRVVLQPFGMGEALKSAITSQDTDCP